VLGDMDDIKVDLAALLKSPRFRQVMTAIVAGKQDGFMPLLPAAIYQEERLSHLVFPMAELIGYKTIHPEQDIVVHAENHLGVRWTAVAKDEHTVTRYIELLTRTTVDLLWGASLPRVQSGPVLVTEVDYSPLVPAVDHPYMKSSLVMITVQIWRA
jgi:hypothetical protein